MQCVFVSSISKKFFIFAEISIFAKIFFNKYITKMDTVQISFKSLFEGIDHPVIFILIGLASGYVAGKLMTRTESRIGIIANITVGVLGSLLAGWLFPKIGITFTDNVWGQFLQGLIGAIIILAVINKLKK